MNPQSAPTKGNLISSKKHLTFAKTGFSLLDKKQNILIKELMALVGRAELIHKEIDQTYKDAYLLLQQANVSLKNCQEISESVPVKDNLNVSFRSVMGVEIPIFKFLDEKSSTLPYSMYESNSFLDEAYLKFQIVIKLTVQYAEIENSIYRLARVIGKTKKRANALKNSIIPKFMKLVKNISNSLEEKEREEFSRLKVIKRNKEKS